ncbi:MAG TPA: CAP domain-containing protein, partial [Actinomycetota bacterium]|nr:CAP domain-containing protein [Actinomycetota bacterium]
GGVRGIFHTPAHVIRNRYLDGVSWSIWGENVGVTPGTVADLQSAFMTSELHRANILNYRFRRVAVGTYRDDAGLLWVTIVFWG